MCVSVCVCVHFLVIIYNRAVLQHRKECHVHTYIHLSYAVLLYIEGVTDFRVNM